MKKNRNEIEPPPADDDLGFEDLGPDDLELIGGSAVQVEEEEDDDQDEWPEDPWEQIRREGKRQWLRHLADPEDPSVRIVELGHLFAAVVENGTLYLVSDEKWRNLGLCDASRYSDEELREKIKGYLPFL